jgi:iron complex outermembrane receptor protein
MTHTFFREGDSRIFRDNRCNGYVHTFTLWGKGRALFSLLYGTAGTGRKRNAAKDGETLTVTADPNTRRETNGYQPLNTSTATLTNMPMLDIPQVVNTVSDKVLEDQHATTLDERYNVSNVVQTNTLGGTRMPSCAAVWREPRRLDHDQRPAHRPAAQL